MSAPAISFRVKRIFPTGLDADSEKTRFVPEFTADGGTTWEACYPGDQPQYYDQATNRLDEILVDRDAFLARINLGLAGTESDSVDYPVVPPVPT